MFVLSIRTEARTNPLLAEESIREEKEKRVGDSLGRVLRKARVEASQAFLLVDLAGGIKYARVFLVSVFVVGCLLVVSCGLRGLLFLLASPFLRL